MTLKLLGIIELYWGLWLYCILVCWRNWVGSLGGWSVGREKPQKLNADSGKENRLPFRRRWFSLPPYHLPSLIPTPWTVIKGSVNHISTMRATISSLSSIIILVV